MLAPQSGLDFERIALDDHLSEIRMLLNTAFGADWTEEEVRWKYQRSPFGPMTIFAALDSSTRRLAGIFSCSRREHWYQGAPLSCYQQADAVVAPEYQGRGIFRELTLRMTSFVRETGAALHYGFTNEQSAAAMRRMEGSEEVLANQVFAFPFGAMNVVTQLGLPQLFVPILSPLVKMRSSLKISSLFKRLEVSTLREALPQTGNWSQRMSEVIGITPNRTQEYVTWRCFNAPLRHRGALECIQLRLKGEAVGYAAVYREQRRRVIKLIDLIVDPGAIQLTEAYGAVLRYFASSGADAVVTNVASAPLHIALKQAGFSGRSRERSTVFPVSDMRVLELMRSGGWLLAPIDRDTFGDY